MGGFMKAFGILWANDALFIYVLSIIFLTIVILIMHAYKIHQKMNVLVSEKWKSKMFLGYSSFKRIIKNGLIFVAMFFLCVALLGPQWGNKNVQVAQEGRDLLIALDISRSMLAEDIKPNRLAFAKNKIKNLLNLLDAERVGLILFAGSAMVQCPLTSDIQAFELFLNDLDSSTIASGTTAIDQAIIKALEMFHAIPGKKTKLLAIVTDGEDYSTNLQAVQQRAREDGLTIFTMGVGTKYGAPVPIVLPDGSYNGYEKDENGIIVMSQLDEDILKKLAQQAGGIYVRPTKDNTDIDSILSQVRRFEKEEFENRDIDKYEHQYPYFIMVSLICLALEWII
jgi:Ca-activated chloride channel homolog